MIFRNRLVMDSYYRETVALKTANEKMEDELVERDNRIRELESTAAKMERLIDDLLAENAQLRMRVYQERAKRGDFVVMVWMTLLRLLCLLRELSL